MTLESRDNLPAQHTAVATPLLDRVLFGLALLALALAPTQLTLPRVPLAPADLALALAALVWAIRWITQRDSHSLPPLVSWLLVAAMGLSIVGVLSDIEPVPGAKTAFLKEIIQMVLYLLVGVTVFRAVFSSPQRIRTAVIVLLATTSLAVLLGVVQRGLLQREYQPDASKRHVFMSFTPQAYVTIETPIEVSSTFGSWNDKGFHASRMAYAGFLALTLPFALALLVNERRKFGYVIWMSLLFIGVAASLLAGYVAPALLLGLLVTGCALGLRTACGTLAGIVIFFVLLTGIGGHNTREVTQEPFRSTISATDARNPNYRYGGVRHLKKIWGEQLASLNALRGTASVKNPALFGVGAGQYQKNIQGGFDGFGDVSNQRLESDAQSGYLLMMLSTGLLGLSALLALYGSHLATAWRNVHLQRTNPWAAAALGIMVTLVTLTVISNPWVRGTSVVIAAVLAMIQNSSATFTPSARMKE